MYLDRGTQTAEFVRHLSAVWPDIFSYLRQHPHETDAENHSRLSNALLGANPDVKYRVSDEDRELIEAQYANLPAITDQQSAEQAEKTADVLRGLGVHLSRLVDVAEPLRARIVERNLYQITIANLRAGLGPDTSLSLDGLKRARPDDVYLYMLGNLETYLTSLAESATPSVADPGALVDVLTDLLEDHEAQVGRVASAAAPDCVIENLSDLQAKVWPALADHHRFELTDTNLIRYVSEHGVDEALAGWLGVDGNIRVTDMASDEVPRVKLAVTLLNAPKLPVEATKTTVKSLGLSKDSIDPTAIAKPGWQLVPWLVNEGLIADAAAAFAAIADAEWPVKEELINVSVEFPSYLPTLALTSEDLREIASKQTPDSAKQAMLDNLDSIQDRLSPKGAAALAKWADGQGLKLSGETLLVLASKGGPIDPNSLIGLLGPVAATLDLDSMKRVLNALGEPYSLLTSPGWERPKIPITSGAKEVLARLQQGQIVSSFPPHHGNGVYLVSKKHR